MNQIYTIFPHDPRVIVQSFYARNTDSTKNVNLFKSISSRTKHKTASTIAFSRMFSLWPFLAVRPGSSLLPSAFGCVPLYLQKPESRKNVINPDEKTYRSKWFTYLSIGGLKEFFWIPLYTHSTILLSHLNYVQSIVIVKDICCIFKTKAPSS